MKITIGNKTKVHLLISIDGQNAGVLAQGDKIEERLNELIASHLDIDRDTLEFSEEEVTLLSYSSTKTVSITYGDGDQSTLDIEPIHVY